MNKKRIIFLFIVFSIIVSCLSFYLGYKTNDSKYGVGIDMDNIVLPARSVIEKAMINEVSFSTDSPKTMTVVIEYNAIKGLEGLLSSGILNGKFEANISGTVFLSGSEEKYIIFPNQDTCIFDVSNPSEISISFNLEDTQIPLGESYPDSIQSINVDFSFVSSNTDVYVITTSIVNEVAS